MKEDLQKGQTQKSNNTYREPNENDAERITRRHLENEDDVITDEDIRNIRIDTDVIEPTATGAEAQARFELDNPEVQLPKEEE